MDKKNLTIYIPVAYRDQINDLVFDNKYATITAFYEEVLAEFLPKELARYQRIRGLKQK